MSKITSAIRRWRLGRDQRGSVATEAAIIIPFLIVLTVAIIEFIVFLYDWQIVTNATREGARAALIAPNIGSLTNLSSLGQVVECEWSGGGATCINGTVTTNADAIYTGIVTVMQDLVPGIEATMVKIDYTFSSTDNVATSSLKTPLVSVRLEGFQHTFIVLDLFVGTPFTVTLPPFESGRLSHTRNS